MSGLENAPMNAGADAAPGLSLDELSIAPERATRPLYWSVRREFWEYRSIYIAPLAVAAVFLLGFLIRLIYLPSEMRAASALDPERQQHLIQQPYTLAAALIMAAALLVQLFYCLETLHGERRDRSILFWKSLPVSDLTTVLAKAVVGMVILPLLAFAITVATQLIMLLLSSAVLLANGLSIAVLCRQLSFARMSLLLLYHLVTVHVLWYAPIYAWLLLVSSWARRMTFLWAALPLLAIVVVEKIAFGTSHFAALLRDRVAGGAEAVMGSGTLPMDAHTHLTPGLFLSSPGLGIGLAVAAGFLAAAARLRRYREPI